MALVKFQSDISNLVNGEHGLYATKNIEIGELIYDFSRSKTMENVTQHNSEIGENKYIVYDNKDWSYHNHNCDPNMYHDFGILKAFALRPIKKGDEITRNYCTNHWILGYPFKCQCSSNYCIGFVRGAKYLNFQQINKNLYHFAPHIKTKLSKEAKALLAKL